MATVTHTYHPPEGLKLSANVEAALKEAVQILVDRFAPLKILLFGSYARGKGNFHSDLDLLVVLPRLEKKRETAVEMLRALADLPIPKDVIPTDPKEIYKRGEMVGDVLRPALREGIVVYE